MDRKQRTPMAEELPFAETPAPAPARDPRRRPVLGAPPAAGPVGDPRTHRQPTGTLLSWGTIATSLSLWEIRG